MMGVQPAAEGPAIGCDNPGQANLAREGPPQKRATHGRAAHPPARVALGYPISAADTCESGPALAALQPVLWSTYNNPMAPPDPFLKRIPDGVTFRRPRNP